MRTIEPKQNQDKHPKGSALIMVIFTLFLVTLVVSATFSLSRQNFLSVNRDDHSAKAEFAAKAGLEHSIALLGQNPRTGAHSVDPDGFQRSNIPLDSDPDVTYDIHLITNDHTGIDPVTNEPYMVTAPDGLRIPPEITWVRCTGKLRDRATSSSSSLVKLVGFQRPMLKQALFGINFVEVSGNSTVEGYDFTASPKELGRRGDIAVNAVSSFLPPGYSNFDPTQVHKGIRVVSGAQVKGQARAGVGSVSTAAVINSAGGTIYNAEDPSHHTVVSEEATQVPRFVLTKDSADPDFRYPYRLVVQNLAVQPPPPPPATLPPNPTWVFKAVKTVDLPSLSETYEISSTTTMPPGVTLPPFPVDNQNAYDDLRLLNGGFYDLTPSSGGTGSVVLEDVCLRAGVRYQFLGDVTFKGKINVSDKQPNGADFTDGVPATVIYVDGNVVFDDNVEVNLNRKGAAPGPTTDPLNPRYLQVYSALDKGEEFEAGAHSVTIKPGAKVSCVLGGSNQKVLIDGAKFWGGIQSLEVSVRNGSHVYFDVGLWGQLLEGRGEMAVVTNTVQFYNPMIYPAAPAPTTVGPSTAPVYSYTTGPGWCTSIIPLPQYQQPCY